MSKVIDITRALLKKRDAKILSGEQYVASLLQEVRKEVLAQLAATQGGSYSALYLRQTLASIERQISVFESAASRETATLITDAWSMGGELLPAMAQAAGDTVLSFGFGHLSTGVVDTLKDFTVGKISQVSRDLYSRISAELTLGILGQKTAQEITAAIAGSLPGKSIFDSIQERAEVITQLEMGRAFSIATQTTMEGAGTIIEGLQKMWLHAGHPKKPRQQHLLMHGEVRDLAKPFYRTLTTNAPVMYPRAPDAPISEVIRCGCTHIPYRAQWGKREAWAKGFMDKQYRTERGVSS